MKTSICSHSKLLLSVSWSRPFCPLYSAQSMIVSLQCFSLLLPFLPVMAHKLGFHFLITHCKQMKIYCGYCSLNVCASVGRPRLLRWDAQPTLTRIFMQTDNRLRQVWVCVGLPWFAFGRIPAMIIRPSG